MEKYSGLEKQSKLFRVSFILHFGERASLGKEPRFTGTLFALGFELYQEFRHTGFFFARTCSLECTSKLLNQNS